jgi:SAM-dependent methyltransferase
MSDPVRQLDPDALALFARKGLEAGPGAPQAGEANAVKVRRVMQLTADLTSLPFDELRILDLGCGEGVYAIEAGLRGAEVVGLDARTERMDQGAAVAERHGLANVTFRQEDVRQVTREAHGEFDVVYCLGLLYHLDAPDLFSVLANVQTLCRRMLIIDTLISLDPTAEVEYRGRGYEGDWVREHEDDDPDEVRRARLLRSIDNTHAFRLTRGALVRALHELGFSSVLEGHVPMEPGKAGDRVTLAALAGEGVSIATYPWLNEMGDDQIERRLADR